MRVPPKFGYARIPRHFCHHCCYTATACLVAVTVGLFAATACLAAVTAALIAVTTCLVANKTYLVVATACLVAVTACLVAITACPIAATVFVSAVSVAVNINGIRGCFICIKLKFMPLAVIETLYNIVTYVRLSLSVFSWQYALYYDWEELYTVVINRCAF